MELAEFFTTFKTPITIIHVLSVTFGMGSALVSDVLFTFYSDDKKLSAGEIKTLHFLSNAVWVGLIIIALSGVALFLTDIPRYVHSTKFLAKMTILGVLVINGYILHKYVWKHVIARNFLKSKKEAVMRRVSFACGAISVLSWISVCALGVLDRATMSYGVLMGGYLFLVIVGVLIGLVVEYREFEK